MIKKTSSLPHIAVLRGGSYDLKQSIKDGADVLKSLTKIGYNPLDVLIDEDGDWTLYGKKTDAHYVFTCAHTVVDTTRMSGQDYQRLAKRMGVSILFSSQDRFCMDKEYAYRLLRQRGIDTPQTTVIRANADSLDKKLHSIWNKYNLPIMLRPLQRRKDCPSKLVSSFNDLENTVLDYHKKGADLQVLTYKNLPMSSIAVIPNFRGEELYMPLWVNIDNESKKIPSRESAMRAHTLASNEKKAEIKKIATKVYNALALSSPVCIDVIYHNNRYIVVGVDTAPALGSDGRFMKSLETTGIDAGQYIHSIIQNEFKR